MKIWLDHKFATATAVILGAPGAVTCFTCHVTASACVDVDTHFGALPSGTSEVDLGLTTRLECPKDIDNEVIIPSGAAVTVKSGIEAGSSVQ